jgi:hypothetical protein
MKITSKNSTKQKQAPSLTSAAATPAKHLSPDMLRKLSREALERMAARDKAGWDPTLPKK